MPCTYCHDPNCNERPYYEDGSPMPTEDMKGWDERFALWWSERRVKLEEELRQRRLGQVAHVRLVSR